jgi:signal transduction histidine kinase/ligand-binding sensor domain-containing protein
MALIALVAAPSVLAAQDRLVRRFGDESNVLPPIIALAQDSVGFLWVGTRAGLFRYDGARFRRWAPDVLPRGVGSVAVSPSGMAIAVDADGRILELTADGARELDGSARRSPDFIHVAAFDAAGRLWVMARDGGIAWRDGSGSWSVLAPDALQGDTARQVFPGGAGGGILVASGDGLWRVAANAAPRRLLTGHWIVDALTLDDGEVLALATTAALIRIPESSAPEVLSWGGPIPPTRAISLAERDGTLWVGTDRYLLALAPGGVAEVLGPPDGVAGGGPLLIDGEGSLWHGGFSALSQYPEPDTRTWGERHGLRSDLARFLGRSGDVLWVTTWLGPAFVRREQGRWSAGAPVDWGAQGGLCDDGTGGLWVGTSDGVLRLEELSASVIHPGTRSHIHMCSPASHGGIWIASGVGLKHLSADGATLSSVSTPPFPYADSLVQVVLEDRSGRLWAGSREQICHGPVEVVQSGGHFEWSCQPLPEGIVHLNSLVELPSGALWASSYTMGVLRHAPGGWVRLPDNAGLAAETVLNMVPSPRGGVWLVGAGILQRVEDRGDGAGWRVVERLGPWHGLPSPRGSDVLEDEDGTLWIATSQGVARVPARVRANEPRPPRMALVEARVDGQRVPLNGDLVLTADRNRLELRFAALSFRDPGRVRYQVRLSPGEAWADTDGQPSFTWVDLPAGRHQPQVRASLDGENWSAEPAGLAFRVLPSWYRTPWAVIAFALLAGGLIYGLFRVRLAYLVGLERQRTRIAMDLHDEMGSGLASIGILAGVLSDDGRDPNGARRIAQEVAVTAEELGTALSDIVWSLDPHSATLEELAARVAEHGGRLFADDVQFDTEFPAEWPSGPLPLRVLRNVLLIALEALHNAARHAGAKHVVLSLRQEADGWLMTLSDDGSGLPARRTDSARGRGLRAMRRRAAEIGGDISWTSRPGEGTTVRLSFRLAPPRPWLWRWLPRRRAAARAETAGPASHDHASAPAADMAHR